MVTFAQAQERAEQWVNGDVPRYQQREVRVREFDLGFVAWAEDRPDGPSRAPGTQSARLVIARDSGETTLWPGLPVGEVIRRYEEEYGAAAQAPAAPAAPAGRLDLEATSFLLTPPEWLQEAANTLGGGVPTRRPAASGTSDASGAPGTSGAGASAGGSGAPGSAAGSETSGSSNDSKATGADEPGDSGTATPSAGDAAPGALSSTPSTRTPYPDSDADHGHDQRDGQDGGGRERDRDAAGDGPAPADRAAASGPAVPDAPAFPAAPGSAFPAAPAFPSAPGSSTGGAVDGPSWEDTNHGGDDGDRSVAPPATVFAPPLAGFDDEDTPVPGVAPEAKTELMSAGSALPPTAIAPAIDGSFPLQGPDSAAGPGAPQVPAMPPGPPPGPPSAGGAPGVPAAPGAPGPAASAAGPASSGGPGTPVPAPGAPAGDGTGAAAPGVPTGPGAPGAPAGGYVPTQLVSQLDSSNPLAPPGASAGAGVPAPPGAPGTPGAGTPPPGAPGGVHAAATMLAGPNGPVPPGAPGQPGVGGPQPPGPPGAPHTPPPPVPGQPGMHGHPGTAPPPGPGMPGPGMPGAPAMAGPYGYPPAPTGLPTVGPGYMAVLRYRAQDGSEQQIIRRSAPGTPHPEWQILHELRAMNVPPQQVLELHTELESCDLPGGYCARMIRESWPQVRISHTAPYGRDHATRQQGVRHLIEHQGELHQVADGPARPAPVRVPLPHPSQVQRAPAVPPEGLAQELLNAFGPQGIFRFDQRAVSRQGVPDIVAQTLVWAGLPVDFGPFFWAQAQPGRPVPTLAELAAERQVQPASDAGSYLVMGNDFGRQLCVQYGTAHIVAVPVEAGPGGAPVPPQFVNTGLPEFVRCLGLLGWMWRLRATLTPEQAGRWTVDFQNHLSALDPAALASPENWWAVLLEQMWDGLL
ncbi:SUKH-4 family immunity protein [Streptomyces buecherae]|uniref:SUKH-4 family immunity protein n=1 Tax=Streptomyces buecherae TaxID=2763006 RepID=UPI003794236C